MRQFTMVLLLSVLLAGTGLAQQGKPFVTIGTGGVTGVYYAAGHAIAKVFARGGDDQPFRIDAEASEGSVENINRVLSGEWAFGIAQGDMLYKAAHGKGPWPGDPHENLRAVAALYPEALTIVAAADEGIDTVADRKGKRVAIGASGSADEQNARRLFSLHGLDPNKDLTLRTLAPIDATAELQKGDLDAYFFTVGHPNLSLREATFGSHKVKLLRVDQQLAAEALKQVPYLIPVTIPVDYYPALENKSPVTTLGVKAILFTAGSTPDSEVAAILQALLSDFPRFQRQHPAFTQLDRHDLIKGTVLPLHPAAEAVYRKEGLK